MLEFTISWLRSNPKEQIMPPSIFPKPYNVQLLNCIFNKLCQYCIVTAVLRQIIYDFCFSRLPVEELKKLSIEQDDDDLDLDLDGVNIDDNIDTTVRK